MYSTNQIREYSLVLSLISDVDSLKEIWKQDPKYASIIENFSVTVAVLESIEVLNKRKVKPTYIALVKYFSDEALQNGLVMGTIEKNIKTILPPLIKKEYLQIVKEGEIGMFAVTESGQKLLSLRREAMFISRKSSECLLH